MTLSARFARVAALGATLLSIVGFTLLAGCGGGGSHESTSTASPTPTPTPTPDPGGDAVTVN